MGVKIRKWTSVLASLIICTISREFNFSGKVVNQRHNTGLDHKGEYLHMAQVLAIQNRVPSAHCRFYPKIELNY